MSRKSDKEKTYAHGRDERPCPRCEHRKNLDWAAYDKRVEEGYGTIPPGQWEVFKKEGKPCGYDYGCLDETVDWILTTTGEFEIKYSCTCPKCTFAFKTKKECTTTFLETEAEKTKRLKPKKPKPRPRRDGYGDNPEASFMASGDNTY